MGAVRLGGRRRLRSGQAEPLALGALVLVALALPRLAGEQAPLGVPALGVVAAASLALHGAGIILVHRADRCLNLAQVQIGAAAATLFAYLVQGQTLLRAAEVVCPPCMGEPGPAARGVNFVIALLLALAAAAGIGRLVHAIAIRRLHGSPPVVLTVATAFVVQILIGLQSRLEGWLTTDDQQASGRIGGAVTPPVDLTLHVGGTTLHLPDLLLVVVAVAAIGALVVWMRRTDAGRDLRAASSDPERAGMLGIDAARAAGRAWAIAGLLSGLAGVLTVSSLGLGAVGGGELAAGPLVRILTVAVAAGLASFPLAGLAAVAVGQLDQAVIWISGTATPLDGALVLLIGGMLLLQRRGQRGGDRDDAPWEAVRAPAATPAVLRNLPEIRRLRTGLALAGGALALGLPWVTSSAQIGLAAVAATSAIVGLSILVVTGWAGQVSLGQLAFAAVGAWVASVTHLPLPLALPVGAAAGAALAAAVGGPALRLRGLETAAVTLALALSGSALLLNSQYLGKAMGKVGGDGLPFVDLRDPRVGWYVSLALATGAAAMVATFRRSRLGRALVAARDDEATTQSFGIDVVRARLVGFAAAGGLAAAAGVLLAHLQGVAAPESFTPVLGLTTFTTTVLGGLGSTAGPLLGFALVLALVLAEVPSGVIALVAGTGGLALLLAAPGGLIELVVLGRDAVLRRAARRRRLDVPGLTAGTAVGRAPIAPTRPPVEGAAAADAVTYRLAGQWGLPGD